MLINEMQSRQARTELTHVITRAREHGEATVLTHYNRPAAVVVPVEWFDRARELMAADASVGE
jgi:prevent-host-death family protein